MSVPTTLDAVLIIVIILLPGYVCSVVLGSTIAHTNENVDFRYILRILAIGIGIHGLLFPVWSRRLVGDYIGGVLEFGGLELWAWLVMTIFVLPLGVGLIVGWAIPKPRVDAILDRFGMGWVDRLPSAWDYAVRLGPCWVRVFLDDGTIVAGRYANRSIASIKPGRTDIYIEKVYIMDGAGNISEPVNDSLGSWIRADSISRIEFLSEPTNHDGGEDDE